MPSVELLTECTDKPLMHARCDSSCANHFSMAWDANFTPSQNLTAFLESAKMQGWLIGLMGCLCSVHHARARETEARIVAGNGLVN